ncbi:hypothetical protein BDZ94DRAFT_1318511 [Collybia nuda]|uniref:F-box domain-containing protein n=1 Tax=Collybia nuda TaxID=64659 RepID=A0A9P5YF39_9AGAR|nr:hypothetical protein BDZ94DRAFT_1318511 [Collybia nuda]
MAFCKRCGFSDVSDELEGPKSDPRQQLAEVEDEILHLETQLRKRLDQRQALKQLINAQSSPLLRLPFDVLSEISLIMFPELDISAYDSTTPLLLGSICKTWRDLAWATPRLWSTILVKVKNPENYYHPPKVNLLEEWLLRSRELPVSIHLALTKPRKPRDATIMWQIMSLIARCSERWQHINLDIPYFFNKDFCPVPKGYSQLQSLRVSGLVWNFPQDLDPFEAAPVLREVSLQNYMGGLFPASSISHLTVESVSIHECLMLLQRHPNLVNCTFGSISTFDFNSTPLPTTVDALSLEFLKLSFTHMGAEAASLLLDKLFVPSLCDLTLSVYKDVSPIDNLVSLVQRSSCRLTRLGLLYMNISDTQLVEGLAVLPSLRELELRVAAFGTRIIKQLTLDSNQDPSVPVFLPNLKMLSLTLGDQNTIDSIALVAMVRSRWRRQESAGDAEVNNGSRAESIARLEAFNITAIDCDSLNDPVILGQLQELEDDGLRMVLQIH